MVVSFFISELPPSPQTPFLFSGLAISVKVETNRELGKCTVCDKTPKVAPDDTMPRRSLPRIKLCAKSHPGISIFYLSLFPPAFEWTRKKPQMGAEERYLSLDVLRYILLGCISAYYSHLRFLVSVWKRCWTRTFSMLYFSMASEAL